MSEPVHDPATAVPLLSMRRISKQFPGVIALDNIDFEVATGEVVALCGENGAGKSTLMKILGGLHRPDAGQISVSGTPVRIDDVRQAMQHGIALIHQELNVLDNLDVAANVFLGREPRRGPIGLIDDAKIHAETRPFLERLGLNVSTRTRVSTLTIAQQQLVEIAKALSQQARLIIMDEPTSSLTLKETGRLLELVRELGRQGVSVVYISHRLSEVVHCASRVVVLRDGRNAGQLRGTDITHDRIVSLMVGRELQTAVREVPLAIRPGYFQVQGARSSRYPDQQVSFAANGGEILGLAGLVGAGRSELAQAIVGLDPLGGPHVLLGGRAIKVRAPSDAIRAHVYLVPEDRRGQGLVDRMTVRQNITLASLARYARFGWIRRDEERRVAREQIGALAIKAPSDDAIVRNLSGGNQQKVVLAKWLSMQPRVLILDEPTRGIDVGARAEIYRLIRALAATGTAIVMISSDMEEILHMADRVAVMHEGRITGVLARPDCNEENIMQLAVGRPVAAALPADSSTVSAR